MIKDASANKLVWEKLGEWANEVDDSTTLILIEQKVDKRTKPYKAIAKLATTIDAAQWTDRDWRAAEEWVDKTAHKAGIKLSPGQVSNMVRRAMIPTDKPGKMAIDQMMLYTALRSLSSLDVVSDDAVATVLPVSATENVFDLLEHAVRRDTGKVHVMLDELRHSEDAHMVFAMIASQWAQLVAVSFALSENGASTSELGIHPFVVQKLTPLSRQVTRSDIHAITQLCADIDAGMKLSTTTPWNAVDRFVLGITLR